MLKEVGASGQISLGKKYAGQLFDVQTAPDGTITLQPMEAVPATLSVQEERASDPSASTDSGGDGWRTPARLARRAAAAVRTQWEEENKETIEAMNQRMSKIGSMARRIHEWRKAKAQQAVETDGAV